MTVKDLKDKLSTYPDDLLIVMSSDAEGNSKSPLAELDTRVYVPNSTWSGETYMARVLTPELEAEGYEEEDCYEEGNGQDAVVLWPTN